ncbi:hypothetical protein H257_17256 [Aphanomyces astaci]|uniref:Queuosine 5'-phosphate N-glycosylase/hydrolase n=1 Tax=Aphanomyces astaci TaxID=112090 RepID=W4FHF1_APHAT|nr:hypothetical protein, variant [Aphanomyces astaci]XP_009844277.1 hypothetical protein H257_17256 [Aphanomyces astaci]ETV66289.1 hypothetical protein H257_17256 [Aphanomyces astaci]ETV66290.1 hypothetical protein, variant [Aphanomyces astaci]|eukprot:XP_009844276.1 hypothetical protein, variant [Aphanomyces astaci]
MGPNSTLRYTPANVRDSCTAYMQHQAKHVAINEANISTFVAGLDRSQFDKLGEPIRYPLSFKSVDEEVNFLALVDLLNFGSGYRKLLHQYCDRGAHETMMFGVIGMYISSPRLDAKTLRGLSLDSVANYFSIPLDRDEELSTGIYISKPGPLKPLAEGIHQVLTETGSLCLKHGFDDLGAFVLAHVHETAAPSTDEALHVGPSAAALVDALAATFPGFCDVHNDVIILKKAQLLASNLYRRFGASDVRFAFQDMETLTACSDNVLPCVLHALGILEYTPALAAAIEDGQVLVLGSDEEVELRAGAVVACDKILAVLQEGDIPDATILALDSYMWRVGKEPLYRPLERHATQDTVLY